MGIPMQGGGVGPERYAIADAEIQHPRVWADAEAQRQAGALVVR